MFTLRRFEMLAQEGTIKETDVAREWSIEYKMSSRESNLAPILAKPTTWQPLADLVVDAVREKQILNPEYRGLISCMEKKDAEAVVNYLEAKYPRLRVLLAVSGDGTAGRKALHEFRTKPADILVTVRMAFIGYDCPQITVVGIFTHYRDFGHLWQLVGRGLRVWDQEPASEQSVRVIAPDDPKIQAFLDQLRQQSDEGLKRKRQRELDETADGAPRDASGTEPITFIESTQMTTLRAVSNDAEVGHDELLLIQALRQRHGMSDDATKIAAFLEDYGIRTKVSTAPDETVVSFLEPEVSAAAPNVLTDKEQIAEINSRVVDVVKDYLASRGVLGGRSDYGTFVQKITARINKTAGLVAADVRTIEQAEKRLAAARRVCGEA